ncbi:MAG: chemotaxis protein CheD [Bacillota bacterium]
MKREKITVRMAEYNITESPNILKTVGLGSCIGIALYDKISKIGGLIHIMLPSGKKNINPAKYADTGIPLLIEKMQISGASKWNLEAKLAGGAQMFNIGNNSNMKIGKRNIKAVKKILKEKNIKITGEDVGDNFGRTMEFYTDEGNVVITSYQQEKKII